MTTLTLQEAFAACQANKSAWLQRREELTQAEQAYREQLVDSGRSLQTLREIIDMKKNGKLISLPVAIFARIKKCSASSIRDRLNDFMRAHGAELTAAIAPELMNYSGQHPDVQRYAIQHSLDYLCEALQLWLVAGEKINYSAQDNNILTSIRFKPDAASRDDSREKFTPAHNLTYILHHAEQAFQ